MKFRRVSPSIGLLIGFVTMLACTDRELATAPAAKPDPVRPSSVTGSLGSFSDFLGPEGGDTLVLPSYAAYPEGIKAVFTVSGKIHVTSDPGSSYFHSTVDAGPGGVWVGGVYQYCAVGVWIRFGGTVFGPPPCVPYDSSSAWSVTAVVSGSGYAKRNPGVPDDSPCDGHPCHTYTQQQTVTVAPLAGDLDLQAHYELENRTVRKVLFVHPFTNTDTYANQTVSFTDATTPPGLPIKPLSDTWTMADPSAPPGIWYHTYVRTTSCLGSNPAITCYVVVREAGIWAARARVNGVEHDDDVTIYCYESEPLLNNDIVRQQLLAVLDSSNAGSPDYTQRNERFFFVLQDTVTPGVQPYLQIFPHLNTDDVCSIWQYMPDPSLIPPNTKVIAQGHDHPSEPNLSVNCKDSTGAYTIPGTTVYGGDQVDRDWADAVNRQYPSMPEIIIDKHNVYIMRPGDSLGAEKAAGNKFSWDGLSTTPDDTGRLRRRCGWPKRILPFSG